MQQKKVSNGIAKSDFKKHYVMLEILGGLVKIHKIVSISLLAMDAVSWRPQANLGGLETGITLKTKHSTRLPMYDLALC